MMLTVAHMALIYLVVLVVGLIEIGLNIVEKVEDLFVEPEMVVVPENKFVVALVAINFGFD